jgi:alpha-L-fucosidase 2
MKQPTISARRCLIAMLLCTGAALIAADASVDWPGFLARQDPVWHRMPTTYYEGPFVGNGLVGTVAFQDDKQPNTLGFELGRTDVYDHREGGPTAHYRCRLPIGRLLLTAVGKITAVNLRTDLWNAEITGTLTTSVGTLHLRCFAPSGGEVIAITTESTGGEDQARWSLRPMQGDSGRFLVQPKRDKNFTYVPNPPVQVSTVDGLEVAVQPLVAGSDYATSWQSQTAADGSRTILVGIANRWAAGKQPVTGSAADAVAAVRSAAVTGIPALEAAHRAWWHAYYPASFVSIPDPRIESFYWIQLYKMASATRPDRPVVDLMGPWFKPSVWAAYWQNLNTQLAYYTTNVTNHADFNEAPNRQLEERTADLIANVPKEWQADCAALGNPTGYGELQAPAPGPVVLKPGQHYSYIALPWLMQQFCLYERHVSDPTRLRTTIYPLLKRTMNVYLRTLVTGADGRYHVPLAFSDEYGVAEDTNMNLAFIHWGLETLLACADRLQLDEPLRPRWREVLAKLVDYQIDPATGFMIGKDVPFAKSHRHSSHLFAVFPLQTINRDNHPELIPVIERSLHHFTALVGDECMFKFTGASSLWASLGRGDEALTWLQRALVILPRGPTVTPNTLYSENGWPTFESPISAARNVTDLLFQSWGGTLRIFPALPPTWQEAAFQDLRGEGAFLVSAVRHAGQTNFVRITSLAGEPCQVRCDLPAPIRILGRTEAVTPDANGVLHLTLATGETATLVGGTGEPNLHLAPLDQVPAGPTWGLP